MFAEAGHGDGAVLLLLGAVAAVGLISLKILQP